MRRMLELTSLLALCVACSTASPAKPAREPTTMSIHLLLTSDEHGWIAPLIDERRGEERGGAQRLFAALSSEGYVPGRAPQTGIALVSSGDMWTGPFEDVVEKGKPMVAAMNRMGYVAAALGNHEFDFGVDAIEARAREASFPLLAANLVDERGQTPPWVKPFVVVDVGGVSVGVVGLTNVDARTTGDPRHMVGLRFLPYEGALDRFVPQARAAGASQIVVAMHDGASRVDALVPVFRRLHVRAVLFGHDHHAAARIDDGGTPDVDDDIVLCNGGPFMRSYCRVDLTFAGETLVARAVASKTLAAAPADHTHDDAQLARILDDANRAADAVGSELLATATHDLSRGVDGSLGQLVVDAWLKAVPRAQIAMTNAGGLRQDIPAGAVRLRDVMSAMPFNNHLLLVKLTGRQVKETLALPHCIAGGVAFSFASADGRRDVDDVKLTASGAAVEDEQSYVVVVNDFMYLGGDHYRFHEWDPAAIETGIDWRTPVLQELRARKEIDVVPDHRAARR